MIVARRAGSKIGDAKLLVERKQYSVFAILMSAPVQYLVWEEESFSFPFFVSAEAVDIVTGKITGPMFFCPAATGTEQLSSRAPIIGFREIVEDRSYYQRLVDGEESAVKIWQSARLEVEKANLIKGG